MKYARFILIAISAVFLAYFFFVKNGDVTENETQDPAPQPQIIQKSFETKIDEQGQVTVKVTPQTMNGEQWKFDVVLDTHSVELDQDIMQIATLVDDKNNTYKPTSWDGAEPGGHHREGTLIFNPVQPPPKYVELKIGDVGGIAERSFKWNIE